MNLQGKKIAIIATDGFEYDELHSPKNALEKEGAEVRIFAPDGTDSLKAWKDGSWAAERTDVDGPIVPADAASYDALVLPGGVINADRIRTDESAVKFVKNFAETGKPMAVICHAPWLLIEALDLTGRRLTSYHSLKTDLINAGAYWEDHEVVADGNLITSRNPKDLPAFNRTLIERLRTSARGVAGGQ